MANLIIVESASKCKTIQKYLGDGYTVLASLGHVVNLPHETLGINTDTWELTYEPLKEKAKALKQLKSAAAKSSTIYLASDPDREGEAIAWHLKNVLNLKNPKRIVFNEITKTAVQNAITNPRDIDYDLVGAQEARRALDRLVGYKISPLVGRRFGNFKLSAGRVQSVALRKITERFNEYNTHEIETFWNVEGTFDAQGKPLQTDLFYKNKKAEYQDLNQAKAFLKALPKVTTWTVSIEQKKSIRNPSAPYTTSAFQQEAYDTFSIPAKSSMRIAQDLYESGKITYMRTDSVHLSNDAIAMIKAHLGPDFQYRGFKSKVANAQEAHECIRPTKLNADTAKLSPSHKKIYDLIWRKAVASQMPPAEYQELTFTISSPKLPDYAFVGKLSFLTSPGYLKVWQPNQTPEHAQLNDWLTKTSPPSPVSFTAKGKITKPEGLYNEPMLIKWMEKEGIGRPSTYAGIVDKLFEKGYLTKGPNPLRTQTVQHVTLQNNTFTETEEVINLGGKETDRFIPNSIAQPLVSYLQDIFPSLLDYKFTANMEDQLDAITRKETSKQTLLTQFYKNLLPILEKATQDQKEWRKNNPKSATKTSTGPAALQTFGQTSLVNTRFGPALYTAATKSWVSLTPFLKWRKKEPTDLTQQDVDFLTSLPKTLNQTTKLAYGRYGLYLIHKEKNEKLPRDLWDDFYHNRPVNLSSVLPPDS